MDTDRAAHPLTSTWVAAVHASENDFTPIGTALVIDARRVLTCAHVVIQGQGIVRDPLWVAFPMAEAASRRLRVISVATPGPRVSDLAVLVLEQDMPPGVTAAPLRCPAPTDLVGRRWWAFGFANGDPIGNSADGLIGASLGYGWVRLDAESRYFVAPGFSGGGLWSPDYEAVVALVGDANDRGDGRAITLYQANLSLPGEKIETLASWSAQDSGELALAAWGWTLARDPEAQRHWRPRARGVSIDSERGYRFRGRRAALTAIVEWLDRPIPDRRVLVVTGSPGVGKSAVLGRVVTTADAVIRAALPPNDEAVRAEAGSVACAVHAKGKTALEIAAEIARASSARLPEDAGDLGPALRDALAERRGQRFNVIIDALDEAASPAHAREVITKIVLPLAESCSDLHAQVIVGSRRRDDGGDLLKLFGEALAVIDLDEPQYFEETDLADYAMASLQLTGDERPGNPYAADAIAGPLACRIAELADRNFLIAGLVARAHGLHDQEPVTPRDLVFTATVDSVLTTYIERIGPVADLPAETALTALAFAEAPGLAIDLWQLAIEAISGYRVTNEQLARFARSSAANFLVESSSDGSVPVFRLFHQALNDALLLARSQFVPRSRDERGLSQASIRLGKQSRWRHAPAYLLRSLPAHAAIAGVIDDLLLDDDYLLYADLRRLIPLTGNAASESARRRAWLLRLTPEAITADPQNRAALFSVTEALEDLGHTYPGADSLAPYRAPWASAISRPHRANLVRHTGGAIVVRPFTLDGHVLLATSGGDRAVRLWDPGSGEQRAALEGHSDWVRSVCAFTRNDQVLLATASDDRTVRIWDPRTGEQQVNLDGHRGGVYGVCAFTLDGHVLLASGGRDLIVRIWDAGTGEQRATMEGHTGWIRDICAFALGSRVLLATASADGTVRIWDPSTGAQRAALEGHTGVVYAVCAFALDNKLLLASASDDRTVRIWDPATGEQQAILEGHTDWVNGVCAFTLDGQVLLATAGGERAVRLWDPATGQELATFEGRNDWVRGICAFALDGEALLATGGGERTVRIWDPRTGQQWSALESNTDWVNGVCAFTLGGQALVATCGERAVRICDPVTGEQWTILQGHVGWVYGVCSFTLGGEVLLATVGADGIARIWHAKSGAQWAALEGHVGGIRGICAFRIDGRVLLATGGDDRTLRTWDPATGRQQAILEGHTDGVYGVCSFRIDGQVLLATVSGDCTVRIWDPATCQQRAILEDHTDGVNGICAFTLQGKVLLATASDDRSVRIWDPANAISLLSIPVHHVAQAVCETAGILVTGLSAGVLAIGLNPALGKLEEESNGI